MTAKDFLDALYREEKQIRSLGLAIQYHHAVQAQLRDDLRRLDPRQQQWCRVMMEKALSLTASSLPPSS
jgi:hypothetical protein